MAAEPGGGGYARSGVVDRVASDYFGIRIMARPRGAQNTIRFRSRRGELVHLLDLASFDPLCGADMDARGATHAAGVTICAKCTRILLKLARRARAGSARARDRW